MAMVLAMRAVILIVLGVQLSITSPLERPESSFENGAEPCALGSQECLKAGIHGLLLKEKSSKPKLPNERRTSVLEPAPLISDGCPPGIWTCRRAAPKVPVVEKMVAPAADTSTGERRRRSKGCPPGIWTCAEKKEVDLAVNDNDEDEDPKDCPLTIWVCRKKRMLRRMMKEAKRVQRSAKECPPGIWVC